jgi:hypothetical protein
MGRAWDDVRPLAAREAIDRPATHRNPSAGWRVSTMPSDTTGGIQMFGYAF